MKIVKVEWIDSCSGPDHWDFFEDSKPLVPVNIKSVGFLIDENEKAITVANSVTESEKQANGYIIIPRVCIQNVIEIEIIKEKNMCQNQIQLPKYKCHKEVHALKIKAIKLDIYLAREENRETDGSATLIFEDERYAPIKVVQEYMKKHQPQAGGYYIVYKDGYKSWSPAEAFEDGYELIKD